MDDRVLGTLQDRADHPGSTNVEYSPLKARRSETIKEGEGRSLYGHKTGITEARKLQASIKMILTKIPTDCSDGCTFVT